MPKVTFQIRESARARKVRLTVLCDGNVVVTKPWFTSRNFIEQFIKRHTDWILKKLAYLKAHPASFFVPKNCGREKFNQYKEKARALVEERIRHFNQIYDFKFNRISIKNHKSRWGSCSRKGNLNFNYKIALLPERLANYIIVHELCHLGELNHSRKFWDLVAKTIPDYSKTRKELRKGSR